MNFNLLLIDLPHLSFWLKQKWYQLCSLIHRLFRLDGKNVLHDIFLQPSCAMSNTESEISIVPLFCCFSLIQQIVLFKNFCSLINK